MIKGMYTEKKKYVGDSAENICVKVNVLAWNFPGGPRRRGGILRFCRIFWSLHGTEVADLIIVYVEEESFLEHSESFNTVSI